MNYYKVFVLFLLSFIFLLLGCANTLEVTKDANTTLPHEEQASLDNANLQHIDTSSWKVYVNEKYNFRLKYPDEFDLKEGFALQGTSSEHYAVTFTKDGIAAHLVIGPETRQDSRNQNDPIVFEQMIDGKKAMVEKWDLDSGSQIIHYKFVEQINNWKMCGTSIYCTHISLWAHRKSDLDIVKKMFSTFEFIQSE